LPAEQPGLRLAEDDELGVVFGYSEKVENNLFCFGKGLATGFHPLH